LSFDKSNKKANEIYRITRSFNAPGEPINLHLSAIAPAFGPLLLHAFPEIQQMTRMLPYERSVLRYQDRIFNESRLYFADDKYFNFFTTPVLKGNPATALKDPYCMMMTEEVANKYFGAEDPINKMVKVNNQISCRVTGVFKALPSNAHMHPDILVSFSTLNDTTIYGAKQLETSFGNNAFYTYVMLPENFPYKSMEARFPAFLDRDVHFDGAPATFKPSTGTKLYIQKLTDIHLRSHLDDEAEANGDIKNIYVFGSIALFILLIACINYMNLSTARSALRAREIGIRKVVGAERRQIIWQFLSESIIITFVALVFSALLTWLFLPMVNSLANTNMTIDKLGNPGLLIAIFLMPLLVGFISGIYPALFMSSFRPSLVLKGAFKITKSKISFRQVLVVTQFSISIILIIATAIVFQQLKYMQDAKLGYNKEQLITMGYPGNLNSMFDGFREELLKNPNIIKVGRSSRIPTGRLLDAMNTQVLSGDSMVNLNVDLKFVSVDSQFIPTYGIQMAAGRNFSKDFEKVDSANFIINEAAVKVLGWKTPENANAKDISYGGTRGKIIGVVQDFHFESLHQKIVPLIMAFGKDYLYNLSVRIGSGNVKQTINYIEKTWQKYLPEAPIQYSFMDEQYGKLYAKEQQEGSIFTVFSGIAIFIACLGLFGLSAFAISQRMKEIGIRKVLGASVGQIVSMMSKDFLKLVLIAAIIAFPVAWFAMHNWLQDFAYRINMGWWIFIAAALISALIAFVTISFQSVKAGLSNPVKSLRTE
jgi:putative ABC transport system permease protein